MNAPYTILYAKLKEHLVIAEDNLYVMWNPKVETGYRRLTFKEFVWYYFNVSRDIYNFGGIKI